MSDTLPPAPSHGVFQTAEWDETYGRWRVRDMTPEEIAVAFPPPPPPEPGPVTRVSRRQGRLALLDAGLLDAVEGIMADPETPRSVRITYEDATEWWRDDPMIEQFASSLGLSGQQVDDLFTHAATL